MKKKVGKLDFIKTETFFSLKDTLKRMKGKPQTERKVFAKYM